MGDRILLPRGSISSSRLKDEFERISQGWDLVVVELNANAGFWVCRGSRHGWFRSKGPLDSANGD